MLAIVFVGDQGVVAAAAENYAVAASYDIIVAAAAVKRAVLIAAQCIIPGRSKNICLFLLVVQICATRLVAEINLPCSERTRCINRDGLVLKVVCQTCTDADVIPAARRNLKKIEAYNLFDI